MQWIEPHPHPQLARELAQSCGLSPVVAQILAQRHADNVDAIPRFLEPRLSELADPLLLGNMQAAVERVRHAVIKNESVLVFGDYDVDGVTSTTLLVQFLREFGLSPKFVVPRRLTEGYGLSMDSLQRALDEHRPDLLIAVDCGTSSRAEVAWLRQQNISVVILDHHTSKEALPEDCLIVNPHVFDEQNAPWKDLCSVGLVFKFCHAFLKILRNEGDPNAMEMDLREYLDLVALGTVADLVPLLHENRILVYHGLRRLRNCVRPGLCALMELTGLQLGESMDTFDIGFRIGPRINASGRLVDAALPIELLLNTDLDRSRAIAKELDALNRDRQEIERKITLAAEASVAIDPADPMGLVLFEPEWHTGVVGIVASRLARKFHRPCIVLGEDADGLLKGSGRSVGGVDMVKALQACTEHLTQWGGHPMAVGLSLGKDQLVPFRQCFNAVLQTQFPEGIPDRSLRIDAIARPQELNDKLLEDLQRLAPFGQANADPVLLIKRVLLRNVSDLGKNGHLRFQLPTAERTGIDGVAWGMRDNRPPTDVPVDIAFRFGWNTYRNTRSPRITLLDWRRA